MRTSSEIKAEIEALEREVKAADLEIERLSKRRTAIMGSTWGRGLIGDLRRELDIANDCETYLRFPLNGPTDIAIISVTQKTVEWKWLGYGRVRRRTKLSELPEPTRTALLAAWEAHKCSRKTK